MSDSSSFYPSPQSQQYRIANLRGFLPLSRSSTNFADPRRSSFNEGTRRRSTESRDHDVEAQSDSDSQMLAHMPTENDRRMSVLMMPQMRSQRLIGNSNPRYKWEQYYKTPRDLKKMSKPLRKYYERNNYLIQQYLYIDRLLDSSLPHNLIQEYNQPSSVAVQGANGVPDTIHEEPSPLRPSTPTVDTKVDGHAELTIKTKVNRTPKSLYKVQDEQTPLLTRKSADGEEQTRLMPDYEPDEATSSQSSIVTIAIYVNMAANTVLLILKIIVAVLTSSVSVLASLVDAALDFLSTGIVWTTTHLISNNDSYKYPIGRRRLEPLGVLVFSVIMITSFFQVALEGFNHLTASDHTVVQLTELAIIIMTATVVIKFLCWLWSRSIKNSSVQALAQDAMTDVVFNIFSIIFPLIGFYAQVWWLDPLGGILLSLFVIINWARTSHTHIKNLTGAAASADERNILLYLTMRFAKTVKHIQGLQAYHSGDKLNVEVDVVLDEAMSLRDSHDLGESLQYVLEGVPTVDRAFVHLDYAAYNMPTHMVQGD